MYFSKMIVQLQLAVKTNYPVSIFYVGASFILIYANHQNKQQCPRYRISYWKMKNDALNINPNISNYLDLYEFAKNTQFLVEMIETITFCWYSSFFFLIFLTYHNIFKKGLDLTDQFYAKIFLKMVRPFYWILILPLTTLYFQEIKYQKGYYFTSWINVFLVLTFSLFLNVFFLKNQYFKGDFLKSDSLQLNYLFFAIRIVECFASIFQQQNQSLIIGYQILCILIWLLHYYVAVICRSCFYDNSVNSVYQYGISILIGQSIGQLIQELFNLEENYLFTLILFVIIPMIVNYQLVDRFVEMRYFKAHDFKEQILALTNNNRKEHDYVYYQGLLFQHMSQCVNGLCFTKQAKFYYAKRPFIKGQEYKIHFDSKKQSAIILRFLIKCLYETHLKVNQNDNQSRIGYAEFLYFKMNLVYQANIQLTILNGCIKTISERFQVFYLSYMIEYAMQEKSESSYMNRLPFQQVLLCEETLNHVKRTINTIMMEMVKYWRLQCQSKIYQEELNALYRNITKYFTICEKGFQQIRNFHLHHESNAPKIIQQSWIFYQMLYKVKIRCKKLKIWELEQLPNSQLKACEIYVYENIDESSSDDDKENQPYNSNKIISENTAIIRTDQSGIIIKTNAKMTQVFGMLNSMYVGISIDKLMTKYFQDNHKIYMEQFQRYGKISTLYNRTSIFCEDSNGILFKARKYIKILMNIYVNRFEYVSMIRPVKHKFNYITLNENWEIDSMTFEIKTLIGNNKLPFLIICPKTLCISEYRFMMTQGDLQKFNLKVSKENSKASIQERALTVKNRFDKTFSHLQNNESKNSIVLKSELRINREEEMISIFKQGLEEDNEEILIHTFENEKQVHKRLNIRIPLNPIELIADYHYIIQESIKKIKYSGQVKINLLTKDERGKTKIVKEEFLRRYKYLLKQYRIIRYECLKLLFDKYCSQPEMLQRVIKIDSYIKTYDTLNNKKFITIKIARFEIFDASKSFTALDLYKSSPIPQNYKRQSTVSNRGFHVQKSSELSELQSNREENYQLLIQNNILGGDFDYAAQREQVFSLKADANQFIKEELNKPVKSDSLIRKIMVANRFYLLIQLMLTLLQFFICGFQFNSLTKSESIYLIREIIKFQLYAVESYNEIVDIELFNMGYLDSILLNSSLTQFSTKDDFYQKADLNCQDNALYNYYVQLQSDFIKMTYQNFIIQDHSNRSGLDVQSKYFEAIYSLNQTKLQNITEGNRVLEFYRSDMLTYFTGLTFDTISNLFQDGYDFQILSNTNYYIIALIMVFILATSMPMQFRFIYQHIENNKVIYNQVNLIKKQTKQQCLQEKQILTLQLNFLNDYETDQYQNDKLLNLNDFFTKQVDSVNQAFPIENLQEQEQLNENDSKQTVIEGNFNQFKKGYYFLGLYFISILLVYLTSSLLQLNSQANMMTYFSANRFLNQNYQFWVLISIKEIYINKELFPTQIDYNSAKNILDLFIEENTKLSPKLYSTNIPKIKQLFQSNVCDEIEQSDFQENLCETQLNGALTRGIQEYYQFLEQLSLTTVYDDPRFDAITLEYIYNLDSVQPIVIALYKMIINIWYNDILTQMDSLTSESLVEFLIQIVVLILLHALLIEIALNNYLHHNYKEAKQYYKLYMPNSSINQEKIIRVQIIRTGLLRK